MSTVTQRVTTLGYIVRTSDSGPGWKDPNSPQCKVILQLRRLSLPWLRDGRFGVLPSKGQSWAVEHFQNSNNNSNKSSSRKSSSNNSNSSSNNSNSNSSSRDRSQNSALNVNIAHSVATPPTHLTTVTPVSCQSHRHCGWKHQILIQFPTASRCAPHFLSWCSCWIGALIARRCSVGVRRWVCASRLLLSVGGWPQVPATDRQTYRQRRFSYRQVPLATSQ